MTILRVIPEFRSKGVKLGIVMNVNPYQIDPLNDELAPLVDLDSVENPAWTTRQSWCIRWARRLFLVSYVGFTLALSSIAFDRFVLAGESSRPIMVRIGQVALQLGLPVLCGILGTSLLHAHPRSVRAFTIPSLFVRSLAGSGLATLVLTGRRPNLSLDLVPLFLAVMVALWLIGEIATLLALRKIHRVTWPAMTLASDWAIVAASIGGLGICMSVLPAMRDTIGFHPWSLGIGLGAGLIASLIAAVIVRYGCPVDGA